MPPTSAWWARLATHPTSRPPAWQGATRVTSLRWVPPANGSLRHDLVAGAEVEPGADGGGHRRRHGAQMDGDVLGLDQQLAVRREQGGRAVGPLLDVRGKRGPAQHIAHLGRHAGQLGDQHLQGRRRPSVNRLESAARNPAGWAAACHPGATQMVQSGSAMTAGPATGPARSVRGNAREVDRRRPAGRGPEGDHLDRASRPW